MTDVDAGGVLGGPTAGAEEEQPQKVEPEWERVTSSRFKAMKYDQEQEKLYIRWNNGTLGSYSNIDQDEYEKFRAADSLGSAIEVIKQKGRYSPESEVSS